MLIMNCTLLCNLLLHYVTLLQFFTLIIFQVKLALFTVSIHFIVTCLIIQGHYGVLLHKPFSTLNRFTHN
jgi:hypothetical protein